jgi:hypothetical protein
VLIEILQDVWLHLQLRRADEEHLYSIKIGQEIGHRSRGASLIQLANDGHAQAIERPLPVDRVEIEQSLGWMLSTIAITGIDYGDWRNFGGAAARRDLLGVE